MVQHDARDQKIEVELIPNVGMGSIRFGMVREEVRRIMEENFGTNEYEVTENGQTECYFEHTLRFSYEADNTLSFIETSPPPPIYVTLLGIKTWEIPGNELLKMICEHDEMKPEISERGHNPIFKNTRISLYDLDEQYHHIGNQDVLKWGCIGIGDERYYKAVCGIYGVKD